MAVNEKQFGIRLKDPALQVIEKRTEQINDLAPESKTTAGGVARHAVEEYAKMLDRQDVEVHLVVPFAGLHAKERINLEDHPFIEERDLKVDYDFNDLEKLQEHFNGITEILKRYDYLTTRQLKAWEHIAYTLNWEYNDRVAGLEHARAHEEYERAQEHWNNE